MPEKQNPDKELASLLEQAHLRYIDRYTNGFFRIQGKKTFYYVDHQGKKVQDSEILDRIQALVLPPAWKEVWICPYANGHLQATGFDVAGRKQYRYHNRWLKIKNQSKFENLTKFGKKLPQLRRQLRHDIKRDEFNKSKASAVAITIMDNVFMRVGNSSYEQKYGSYGLTTLKNRHVNIKGKECIFRFRGKKGVQQNLSLKSKKLAHLLRQIKEIPGQTLFQYFDDKGEIHRLDSGDINEYLKNYMGDDFTCKDFRTWAGTVLALNYMQDARQSVKNISNSINFHSETLRIIDNVALALGNTRSVTKKYYIHPRLLSLFEANELFKIIPQVTKCSAEALFKIGEKELLKFLRYCKKACR